MHRNREIHPPCSEDVGSGLAGWEWVIDAFGCEPSRLRELARLRRVCDEVIETLGLNVVQSPAWHQFPGHAGVTGLYLLSESHLACHTYPEYALATFNLYCCRDIAPWPWAQALTHQLSASRVEVVKLARGCRQPGDRPHQTDRTLWSDHRDAPAYDAASMTGEEG